MAIFVDQLGYFPHCKKIAISTKPCNFQIIRVSDQVSVFDGSVCEKISDSASGDNTYRIDFSALTEPGEYYVLAGNNGKSPTFRIGNDIYKQLQTDMSRCLYYQRCGMELKSEYAYEYSRPECHMDDAILLSDYLNKTPNPKTYEVKGGWHDAGDFGRYVTAGAVAVAHMLYAYELYPESFNDSLNIPESGNGIPDILNECRYELEWLFKMQTKDGGVYHKLTAFTHAPFIMPEEDHDQFILFPVSSFAVADFTAVMALASRVYRKFDEGFANRCFDAAMKSLEWLKANPYRDFKNPPGCNTGGYLDDADIDERLWAAAELLRVDKANRNIYVSKVTELTNDFTSKTEFGWTDVSGFASLSILTDPEHSMGMVEAQYKNIIEKEASRILNILKSSGYLLGLENKDFCWGSNMVVANRAMLFILASRIYDEKIEDKFLEAALEHMHYLLGRNALGISYITGEGENAYSHPHNRVTDCDGIDAPMPGWVSGGPLGKPLDPAIKAAIPEGTPPMKCYLDDVGSYSSNEITIYWNSPVIFICACFNSMDK